MLVGTGNFEFFANDPIDLCCVLPPLNAPQIGLLCAACGQDRTSTNCGMCNLHTEPSRQVSISGWYKTFKQRVYLQVTDF